MAGSGPTAGLTPSLSGGRVVISDAPCRLSPGVERGGGLVSMAWASSWSQVEDDVGVRPGATDEHFSVRRRFKRRGVVRDVAGKEGRRARVAHPSSTAPASADIAGVSKVEDAAPSGAPPGGDAA